LTKFEEDQRNSKKNLALIFPFFFPGHHWSHNFQEATKQTLRLPKANNNSYQKQQPMALSRYSYDPFSGFDDFFRRRDPFEDPFFQSALMPVIDRERPDNMILRLTSPGYEINEVDGNYQIAVDVPGVKASDMTVNLENEGRVLHISGGRKVVKQGETTETKFEKRFTIGRDVDTQKMTANLSDGVLTLTAPKKKEEEKAVHTIAITEGPPAEKK
jgi:HSP20 family protein